MKSAQSLVQDYLAKLISGEIQTYDNNTIGKLAVLGSSTGRVYNFFLKEGVGFDLDEKLGLVKVWHAANFRTTELYFKYERDSLFTLSTHQLFSSLQDGTNRVITLTTFHATPGVTAQHLIDQLTALAQPK